MSSDIAIRVESASKLYRVFERPQDRLLQGIWRGRRQYFREFWALHGVSLNVKKGETFGIVGRNGSGKSTLLQLVAGTLKPTSGTIDVTGRVAALLELGSGFNPEYTGRENVYLNAAILGISGRETDDLFDKIADFADIGDFMDQPVKLYSSGMAVRLAFAVQALVPKEVLIVDEALAVGDELFQRKCYAQIDEFKRSGGTILFVSHSGSAVVELCDRAMLLDSGETLIIDTSKKVVDLYHKFLYTPHDRIGIMRQEIVAFATAEELSSVGNSTPEHQLEPGISAHSTSVVIPRRRPQYDPHLVPKQIVRYDARGAEITDPEITTMSGERVNLLVSGEKYVWRYDVHFDRVCENVRFGMLIKTATGYELGGAASSTPASGLERVTAGSRFKIEFTFRLALNEGVYFLNGGVLGLSNDGEVYLDRGIDLAAFRVIHNPHTTMTAIVDFDVVSQVRPAGVSPVTVAVAPLN